jgi:F-type H+-transporting ATPase subunit b
MPQFDPAVWPPQAFWLIVTFAVMCLLAKYVIIPRVAAAVDGREGRIDASLRRAEALKQEADAALAAYERTMAAARDQAHELVRTVREQAAAEAATQSAALNATLSKQIADAEARIHAARTQALASVRELASGVAGAAVERLLGQPMDARAVATAVDAALGGRP